MVMRKAAAVDAVRDLLGQHAFEANRFDRIDRALRPWTREEAAQRFGVDASGVSAQRQIDIAVDSQALFLPLVLDTFAQAMKIDNFFNSEKKTASAWEHWQRNSMDARQTGITRAALQYGTSYAVVTAGEVQGVTRPIITGVSPRNLVAYYGERYAWPGVDGVNSEWPIIALEIKDNRLRLFDETSVYYFGAKKIPATPEGWGQDEYRAASNLELIEVRPHGMDVAPVVRFRDRWLLDSQPQLGLIEPLIAQQNRIDRTAFEQGLAQYFAAFKQRYLVGWMPKDEEMQAQMRVSSTWMIDEDASKVKIGQFEETDISRYIEARQTTIRDLAAIAQVPAQSLGAAAISNVSAEGLASMERAKESKLSELQASLGESYEQLLRLCAFVAGDMAGASDFGAEVKWCDMSARSFAQTVDALGKVAAMLDVPVEALWEEIPGFTSEKIERIKQLGKQHDAQPVIVRKAEDTALNITEQS